MDKKWRPDGWDADKIANKAIEEGRIDFKLESGWQDLVEAGADALLEALKKELQNIVSPVYDDYLIMKKLRVWLDEVFNEDK